MAKPDVYVSIDIEADGPIPGDNSMLNLGAAAFIPGDYTPIATFETNLKPLEGATQDPDTMKFWAREPEAWKYVTTDPVDPAEAMESFYTWSKALPARPTMVVYPTYDFMWMRWYLVHFLGMEKAKLYGFAALDLKSMAMPVLGTSFRGTSKRRMPKEWFKGQPKHDHTGLADAIGQGMLFLKILEASR